jgi:two-component system cell cycle sensor histidine kinase/response regulator CckA
MARTISITIAHWRVEIVLGGHAHIENRLETQRQLVQGVAHDFGHVIGVNKGYLGLLARQIEKWDSDPRRPLEERRESIRTCLTDIQAMRNSILQGEYLLKRLAEFSRLGHAVVQQEDINALVRTACGIVHYPGITVKCMLDPTVKPIATVRGEVDSVILNLLVNARDAMPEGGTILVRTKRGRKGVRLFVTDDGVGMTEEVRLHAIDPFFTTKPKAEGTGLGLATIHGIVTASGGFMRIRSAPGEGTTVAIELRDREGDGVQPAP